MSFFSRNSYGKILENILKFYDGGPCGLGMTDDAERLWSCLHSDFIILSPITVRPIHEDTKAINIRHMIRH